MDVWAGLNKRQASYLKAIYEADQETEKEEKNRFIDGERRRSADEWRWLIYATLDLYDSLLKGKIRDLKMIDQGTGSTFKALEEREYILTRHEPNPPFDPILFVRITPKGRKLVRYATQERPQRLPVGTLREWHWRALSLTYEAYRNGEPGVPGDGFGRYGKIGWNTWLRLRDYKYQKKYHPLVEEYLINSTDSYDLNNYCIRITPFGIYYYSQEYDRYRNLYPSIRAPKPSVDIRTD